MKFISENGTEFMAFVTALGALTVAFAKHTQKEK